MNRIVTIVAILLGLAIPTVAQDFDYQPLQPMQPIQPMTPNYQYQLPTVPNYQIHVPPVPEYRPAPQTNWRDMVDDAMRGFRSAPPGHTPESYQMMLDRQDRATQRRHYGECAKYNRWCVNMLRSLGGR